MAWNDTGGQDWIRCSFALNYGSPRVHWNAVGEGDRRSGVEGRLAWLDWSRWSSVASTIIVAQMIVFIWWSRCINLGHGGVGIVPSVWGTRRSVGWHARVCAWEHSVRETVSGGDVSLGSLSVVSVGGGGACDTKSVGQGCGLFILRLRLVVADLANDGWCVCALRADMGEDREWSV